MPERGEVSVEQHESRSDRFWRIANLAVAIFGMVCSAIIAIDRLVTVNSSGNERHRREERYHSTQTPIITLSKLDDSEKSDRPRIAGMFFLDKLGKRSFSLLCCGSYQVDFRGGVGASILATAVNQNKTYVVDFYTGKTSGNLAEATVVIVRGKAEVSFGSLEQTDRMVSKLSTDGYELFGDVRYTRSEGERRGDPSQFSEAEGKPTHKQLIIEEMVTAISFGETFHRSQATFAFTERSGTRQRPQTPNAADERIVSPEPHAPSTPRPRFLPIR